MIRNDRLFIAMILKVVSRWIMLFYFEHARWISQEKIVRMKTNNAADMAALRRLVINEN